MALRSEVDDTTFAGGKKCVCSIWEDTSTSTGRLHVATYDGYWLQFAVDLNRGGEAILEQETLIFELTSGEG